MKISSLLILLFSFSLFSQQHYYTFSELEGIEDSSGDTHLFYRLYTDEFKGPLIDSYVENSIHHLDIHNEKDSLFLYSGGYVGIDNHHIVDIDFWNNNPSEYIYIGLKCGLDCNVYIKRFDEELQSFYEYGSGNFIKISKQNDSLVYATANYNLKSTDGGRSWAVFDSTNSIVSVNPYNDNIFSGDYTSLYKSTDGGLNFIKVDTVSYNYSKFYYDRDSVHIYNLLNNRLKVSDNVGNSFSWSEKYSSVNKIYLSIDYSESGSVYLADWKYIYCSTDYGTTFNKYKTLDRKIVGIYKKPNSNILYAATKYNLYEITPDSIKVIKSLLPDPALAKYYPLKIGNKWVYEHVVCYFDFPPVPCDHSESIVEVVSDTILSNGFTYSVIKKTDLYGTNTSLERFNKHDATIRKYQEDTALVNNEYIIEYLSADQGDTLCLNIYSQSDECYIGKIFLDDTWEYLFGNMYPKKVFQDLDLSLSRYSMVRGFGIDSISYSFDFGYGRVVLKGCIIDGILNGDTTTVGVDDEKNTPNKFFLSQNYPNPFNPTTKIKFTIPNVEMRHASSLLVTLKVYDILGREISTLVNEEKRTGTYEVEFDASHFSSGIYLYKLQTGIFSSAKKMIYLK